MKKVISVYGIADRNRHKYPAYVHDHNLCISAEGVLKDYFHLERITRIKYDNSMPDVIEDILLGNNNLEIDSETTFLFINSFVGSSFISKNGRIRFDCNNLSDDLLSPVKGYCWIQTNDWMGMEVEAFSISHEVAHAFSPVPFAGKLHENSLMIAFDGGSSRGNFAAFHYKNGKLIQLECNWDLSALSKLYNDNGLAFGLLNAEPGEHCSVPGKLMGYASMGRCNSDILKWLKDNEFYRNAWGAREDFYVDARRDFGWQGNLNENKDPFLYDIAACFQETFRKGILAKIDELRNLTKAEYLYYSGGCALNIVANAELISNGWFNDVFISPSCNDTGLSIGADAYWSFLNQTKTNRLSPYLNSSECLAEYSFTEDDIRKTAEALIKGKVIGVCNGYAEAGPRALGNRSIIGLANSKELAARISMKIKGREWYRPIAPIMLKHNARYFTGKEVIHHLSKLMLLDFSIKEDMREEIEGVVHTNGTARIQTIANESDNPFIYQLLMWLENEYKVRALINTSFNGRGEPIVQTIAEAKDVAERIGLDGLVLNGKYFEL